MQLAYLKFSDSPDHDSEGHDSHTQSIYSAPLRMCDLSDSSKYKLLLHRCLISTPSTQVLLTYPSHVAPTECHVEVM